MESSTEIYYDWYIPDGKGSAYAFKKPDEEPVVLNKMMAERTVAKELEATNQQRIKLFAIKRALDRLK